MPDNIEVTPTPATTVVDEASLRTQLIAELTPVITAKVEADKKVEIAIELDKLRKESDVKIQQLVNDRFKQIKKEQKPLTKEQIQTLLDQEYATFDVKLRYPDDEKTGYKTFTLRELPQSIEKRFYEQGQKLLLEKARELSAASFKLGEGDMLTKITEWMQFFNPVFDIMADACAMCLNPFGTDPQVNKDWVQKNVSSYRILMIVRAQVEINKLRDFFSSLFQNTNLLGLEEEEESTTT